MTFSRKGREKKGWKAFQLDYDYIFSLSDRVCCYGLTDQQVGALLAMTEYIGWPTRWVRENEDVLAPVVLQFADNLERNLMGGCCDDNLPIQYRYGADGILERSLNAGGNWTDAPEYDYRNTSTRWPDPNDLGLPTSKCSAADGVIQTFKEQINAQVEDDATIANIAAAIIAALLIFVSAGTSALIAVQIGALTVAIFRAGVSVWKALFTTTVWDDLRCIIFNAMDSDSSVSADGIQTIKSEIGTKFTGIVAATLAGYVQAAGSIGLTNMMRSGAGAADANCDSCIPGCSNNFIVYPNSPNYFGVIVHQTSTYVIVRTDVINTNGQYYTLLIQDTVDDCCTVRHDTYTLHTTNEADMTEANMLANGIPSNVFGSLCGSAWGTGQGAHADDQCLNQMQNQSVTQFATLYYKDAC